MRKKLLYIAPVIIDLDKLNGVSKKVLSHYKTFAKFYNTELVSYGPNCLHYFHDEIIEDIPLGKINRRFKLYSYIKTNLLSNEYDYIYIRYSLSDFLFIYILRLLHINGCKIVIEIPTFPYKYELLKWKNGVFRFIVDSMANPLLKKYVGRIVTYSDDDTIFGIKTIKTINGIIYSDVRYNQKQLRSDEEINLISVSVTMACHGYDRLIDGLNIYYKNGGQVNILYHVVGDGEEITRYRELVKEYRLEKHVVIYGFKGGDELDIIYEKADIAINSLAIHRIGLKTESTIKSKEYAAKGLPIVSSYEIDAFSGEDNDRYVLKVKPDDTPIDIESLVQFYFKIYSNKNTDMPSLIRKASQNRSDMVVTLQGVVDYFNLNIEA